MSDEGFDADAVMGVALDEARAALAHDDVPVGAVIVRRSDGAVLSRRHNERELAGDPTAHAELLAIADAAAAARRLAPRRLRAGGRRSSRARCARAPRCSARIPLVVFGAADPKAGALGSLYHLGSDPRLHHGIDVRDGVRADESATLLKEFFAARRLQ